MRRLRHSLRARLALGATLLAVLAVAAAAMAVYGFGRTRALAAEAMAAQHRIEAYATLSIRANEWMLGWLTTGQRPGDAAVLGALEALDRLVAEDVAAAPDETEATRRARQSMAPARLRAQFRQLDAALAAAEPGSAAAGAALAFYAAQAPGVVAAQVEQEIRRRDLALAAMDGLGRPLLGSALAVGLAAPLLLLALYLWLFRPLFARLGQATAAAEALVQGDLPASARGHDELGLMFARLRQMAARIDRRRALLAQDHERLEGIVAGRTAELQAANARLAGIDSARRRFFADVGHELRTPLTVILGEAELGEGSPDAAARLSFATIRARAQRLYRRIEDLLRIARSESGNLELARERVDLARAANAALADLAPVLKRAGVTARVDLPELPVRGDADWLRQVFAGFYENAAKYAGRGAEITIGGSVEGGRAVVRIADTGPGLPPGRAEEVFARFARGPGSGPGPAEGFGVGLALARWVAEASGGQLVPEPGPGFRLHLELPLWEEALSARILIIEDDPDIASLLARGLGAAGHATLWAETAAEAEAALRENGGCDAAIVDMMLGDESGAALLAGLRAQGHRLPAIMLSALARVEDRAEGLEAGAQDYVVKPFQLSELLARLEVQLRRAAPRVAPLALGRLVYDPSARSVTGGGRPVVLTEREGELLALLLSRPGQVLTRGELFDALWARHGGSTENVVDVYLGYLRRKLGNFVPYGLALRTLRGRGFVLTVEDAG